MNNTKIFLSLKNISAHLGLNFSVRSNSSKSSILNLTLSDLMIGHLIEVDDEASSIFIKPKDINVGEFELPINRQNTHEIKASTYTEGAFRPTTPDGSVTEFRKELFPSYKIQEIKESVIGETVCIDFFNSSIKFKISSVINNSSGSITKTAITEYDQQNDAPMRFFTLKTSNGTQEFLSLDIYDLHSSSCCTVVYESETSNFYIKEFHSSDLFQLN